MFGLGPLEIGIIVLVLLLLFGPKQLPKFARSIGQTIGEIKHFGKEVEQIPKNIEKIIIEEGKNGKD